jgi:hypothetical protein
MNDFRKMLNICAVLGAVLAIAPNAAAQSAPPGYKFCNVATPCDQPGPDGNVVCSYINSDNNEMKVNIYRNACKATYGPQTGYMALSGHPACVIKTLVRENANCPSSSSS